jgi:hypothetical protein
MAAKKSKGFWREWGLTTVLILIFLAAWVGQAITGWLVYDQDQQEHGEQPVAFATYLVQPHFWEATTENWESEFLQALALVVLTIWLRQRGSAESDEPSTPPGSEKQAKDRKPPLLARRPGLARKLYEHSLSIALLSFFLLTFAFHVVSGAEQYSNEQRSHGGAPVSAAQFLAEPQLWFESFQNWQSEFLASGLLVILTVYLREKGSSQSKAVDEANDSTGE